MDKNKNQQLEHLINFALNKKSEQSDSCVIALYENDSQREFSLERCLENKAPVDFLLNNVENTSLVEKSSQKSKKNSVILSVDFSKDESENQNLDILKNHIAKKLPIIEIIDLIGFALECNVITDVHCNRNAAVRRGQ